MLVVLAHTLKPPSETRIYDKLGASIALNFCLKVEVWGAKILNEKIEESTDCFIPKAIFCQKKGFSYRIENLNRFWNNLQISKPEVVICCSPDLLLIASIYKLVYQKKIIWDLQENYSLNLKYQKIYKKWIFKGLKLFADPIQKLFLKIPDQIWLAEEIYSSQLCDSLKDKKWILLENRISKKWEEEKLNFLLKPQNPYFLFSGVITKESGIEKAIRWMDFWVISFPEWYLRVCGYCPDKQLITTLQRLETTRPWLILENIESWKSSEQIKTALVHSTAILMPYIESEANRGKKPTKWFESQWAGKPALVQKDGNWNNFEGCIQINYDSPNQYYSDSFEKELRNFTSTNKLGERWLFEGQKIANAIASLINEKNF